MAALSVVAALSTWACWQEISAERSARDAPCRLVVVQPGDSLWSIAERHGAESWDVRRVVARMREVNRLDGADLRVGMRLMVPCTPSDPGAEGGDA
jgi:hypothetical protein